MSRIQEALKKAARERSTQLSIGSGRGAVEIAAEIPRLGVNEPTFPRLSEQGRVALADTHDGPLQFEALVKRCAHPTWRLNALSSVFQNATPGNAAAERFPPCPCRLFQRPTPRPLSAGLLAERT